MLKYYKHQNAMFCKRWWGVLMGVVYEASGQTHCASVRAVLYIWYTSEQRTHKPTPLLSFEILTEAAVSFHCLFDQSRHLLVFKFRPVHFMEMCPVLSQHFSLYFWLYLYCCVSVKSYFNSLFSHWCLNKIHFERSTHAPLNVLFSMLNCIRKTKQNPPSPPKKTSKNQTNQTNHSWVTWATWYSP